MKGRISHPPFHSSKKYQGHAAFIGHCVDSYPGHYLVIDLSFFYHFNLLHPLLFYFQRFHSVKHRRVRNLAFFIDVMEKCEV